MCLIQIKHAQIKFHLFGFWTVYAPGTDAYPEHTGQGLMRMLSMHISYWRLCSAAHQFLTRMLSISIKIPNLKEVPSNHAEHTRKELVRKLIFLPPNHVPRKTLFCKNQENPSDWISHAWAPLKEIASADPYEYLPIFLMTLSCAAGYNLLEKTIAHDCEGIVY
jgi:hypothetical protein